MRLLSRRKIFKIVILFSMVPVISYLITCRRKANGKQVNMNQYSKTIYWSKTEHAVSAAYQNQTPGSGYYRNNSSLSGKVRKLNGMDIANDYCNSPFKDTTGSEGIILKGFKLRNVHVFIHNGDRTSIHRYPWHEPDVLNCKFDTWYNGTNTKFKRFADVMDTMAGKQGRRNHFLNWALYPDRDVCANSFLTSRGALQHLKLGQHFFDSYSRHASLFAPKLTLSNQLAIKSTSISRTYQSAVAFLYGFLPKFNISHIKIDNSQDMYFCSKQYSIQKSCYCKYATELKILSDQIQKMFDRNHSFFKKYPHFVKELFNLRLPSVTVVAEVLIPLFCHNITLPCSYSESPHGCQELIDDLWNTISARELLKYNDPNLNYLKYSSIVMTPVLIEIIDRIRNIVENRPTPKFILYSGLDVALSPLLYVLGLHDARWPPYASRVVIELLEHLNGTFYLRFIYNGIDRTEEVIFCRGLTYKRLCKFSHFIEFVFVKMLKRFGFSSFSDACSR